MNIAMNDFSSFAAGAELAPLTGLSIQHTRPGVTPAAPSNEDRARAFRNALPVALANHFHWPFLPAGEGQQAAAGAIAASERPGVPGQGKKAGNRRLSLVRSPGDYLAGRCQRSDMQDSPASILPISQASTGTTR